MRTLEINVKFQKYFGELDYGQEKSLERSLLADLTTEPILWWHNPDTDRDEILDGHHRYRLAQKHGLELAMHEKYFASEDEALAFVIRHQTTRRNLDKGMRDNALKDAVRLEIAGGKAHVDAVADVASDMNVSKSTVYRALEDEPRENPVKVYMDAKRDLENTLNREKSRAVEKFKVRVAKEGMDEDSAQAEWNTIADGIDAEYAEQIAELEQLASVAQDASENDRTLLKDAGVEIPKMASGSSSGKRENKARAQRKRMRNKLLKACDDIENKILYHWTDEGGDIQAYRVAVNTLRSQLGEAQSKDDADAKASKKKRFGR